MPRLRKIASSGSRFKEKKKNFKCKQIKATQAELTWVNGRPLRDTPIADSISCFQRPDGLKHWKTKTKDRLFLWGEKRISHIFRWILEICFFSWSYLPSWVPIHTVPADLSEKTNPNRLWLQKRWPVVSKCFQKNVEQQKNIKNLKKNWTLLKRDWPTGGTAQMQRAGAVGGRLNWSSTVLDRAGSITVMSLQEAGPETTHTEHWRRGADRVWRHETSRI